jgi:hypothetical protein
MNTATPTPDRPAGFVCIAGPYDDSADDQAALRAAVASLRRGGIEWRLVVTEHGTELWRDRKGTLDRNGKEIT